MGVLQGLYPPDLAAEWDNVGLQVGDPAADVEKVLVALDPSEAAVEQACSSGCQALLTHHPLFLRPLKALTPGDTAGRTARAAIAGNLNLLAAHTNLDSAADGLNDWLSAALGVQDADALTGAETELVKLVVFIPAAHAEAVAEALFAAGAGHIGGYSHCGFRTAGRGSFLPGEDARPFIGQGGQMEYVDEVRFETILPRRLSGRVLDKMRRAHPYEEVAYDLYPLHNRMPGVGLGRIGRLATDCTLEEFAHRTKEALGIEGLRLVGAPQRKVRKVAVCGGSGASLIAAADRQGADVLVTGDIKYHEARDAEQRGIALLDAGHFGTEHLAVAGLVRCLGEEVRRRGLEVTFIPMSGEQDPFTTL